MKKYTFYFILVLLPILSFGQKQPLEAKTSYSPLITTSKTGLLRDVDVIFNTRMAFDNYFADGDFIKSQFVFYKLYFLKFFFLTDITQYS